MTTSSRSVRPPNRVGPAPEPPPDRLTSWVVLDLLATARRWRAHDQFIAGRIDALGTAIVDCRNAGHPVPRWLRTTTVGALLDHLWEYPRPIDAEGARRWASDRDAVVALWREETAGKSELR